MNLRSFHFVLTLVIGLGGAVAYGDDDSSADAGAAFAAQVDESTGVVIRVPLNERGEEIPERADLRVHLGDAPVGGAVETTFDAAVDAGMQPDVSTADIDRDSSTSGWYGGGHGYYGHSWRPNGYYHAQYYQHYRPTYYHVGSYRNYDYSYQYNRHYSSPYNDCYGYRYYYYSGHW